MTINWLRLCVLCILAIPLTGCADIWLGEEEQGVRIVGKRLPVIGDRPELAVDPIMADVPVDLPESWENAYWPQTGGYADHAMGHLALGTDLNVVWRVDTGAGGYGESRLLAQPIVVDDRIFTLDTEGRLSAFDAETGRHIWKVLVTPPGEEADPLGGGIAFSDGQLFVTAGFNEVISVDPDNGGLFWRHATGSPVRSAPTAVRGRVYAVTLDNRTRAISTGDGSLLWT
ncbi:MAG: PQQ-binding-like beta-propeller repeat protein, partial [Pseudomonadota bacterium]|nr:PQQ-binding-like beta-propeller repeat protein [Pseudomonadota bacterium]